MITVKMNSGGQFEITCLSLSLGQVIDIIDCLNEKEQECAKRQDYNLAKYYLDLACQFGLVADKLQDYPGEEREAHLVMTA